MTNENKETKELEEGFIENDLDEEFLFEENKSKNILKKKDITALLLMTLVLVLEFSYFGYLYYSKNKEIERLNGSIQESNKAIETIQNMSSNNERISFEEKNSIINKYGNQSFKSIGVETKTVEIVEKISKKGSNARYFILKIYYNAEDLDAVKNLIALEYLDPNVYKITKVTEKYIEVILKEE